MTPNPKQQLWLQQYLRNNLSYQETYAEFYDHILAALENMPLGVNFADAIKKVIDEDFGGIRGMRTIEIQYQKSTFREMQTKYFDALLSCLAFPQVFLLLAYSAIVCYTVQQRWYNFFVFLILMIVVRLIPGSMKLTRYVRSGYVFGDIKRSVKDSFFKWVDYISGIILLAVLCGTDLFKSTPPALLKNPIFNAIFLVICGWHAIALYRVYRHDITANPIIN
jgi:hypothetical protein